MKYQHDTVNSFSFLCGMSVFCLGLHSMKITLVWVFSSGGKLDYYLKKTLVFSNQLLINFKLNLKSMSKSGLNGQGARGGGENEGLILQG